MSALLHGCKAIAMHLSTDVHPINERQVRHMIAQALIPSFKLGGVHCTTPSLLAEHFNNLAKGGIQ